MVSNIRSWSSVRRRKRSLDHTTSSVSGRNITRGRGQLRVLSLVAWSMLSISSFRYWSASRLRRRADAPQATSSTPTTMSSATAAWVSPSRAVIPAKASITPKYSPMRGASSRVSF